jgi:altronate hydrolase
MKEFIKINPKDNVVIALADLPAGHPIELDGRRVFLTEPIPRGHKIALEPISAGMDIIKYGLPIGHALAEIAPGQHVHVHNVKTNLGELDSYSYNPHLERVSVDFPGRTVNVYRRANGEVGIRNELWIVPTVGCVNGIGELIAAEGKRTVDLSAIDGINVLKHPYGCSQLGSDHVNTRTILQDAVRHPNAGGYWCWGWGVKIIRSMSFGPRWASTTRPGCAFW